MQIKSFQIKTLLLILLLSSAICKSLEAQQVISERVGNKNIVSLIIPTQSLAYKNNDINELTIQVVISMNNKLVHRHNDILILEPVLQAKHDLFYQYSFEAGSGNYDLNLKINNRTIGNTVEKSFSVHFAEDNQATSSFYMGYYYNKNLYLASSSDWQNMADSLLVLFYHERTPDKAYLVINDSLSIQLPEAEQISYIIPAEFKQESFAKARIESDYDKTKLVKYFELFTPQKLMANQYSPQDQLQQIRYLLSQNDYKKKRKLKDEQLEQAIRQYWLDHDPSPNTLENEYQAEIYTRINEANRRFGVRGIKQGWKTDFGMVYIKYGEPDEIQKEHNVAGKYPVEIWIYRSSNKVFYFDDKKGYGYYELRRTSDF